MRNRIILLAAAALLAACADDQQSTSPTKPSAQSRSASSVGPTTQSIKVPEAKPTDQVGLTTVFTVAGNGVSIGAGTGPVTVTATCPDGSQAIGGSYAINNYPAARYLLITKFGLNAANGWEVTGWVADPLGLTADVVPTVVCIK